MTGARLPSDLSERLLNRFGVVKLVAVAQWKQLTEKLMEKLVTPTLF